MKKILGLDLGTTSIGWALVNEAENNHEQSSIIKLGVRVNPLSVDKELSNFEKGKGITINADRTAKRSARRNLQRFKLRREQLVKILKENGFINTNTILCEDGNHSTFKTYYSRAKAATEKVSLEELARIFLMINKKRGYKSSRKAKSTDEGFIIDGMDIAKKLYDEGLTPGQYIQSCPEHIKITNQDFYKSDLEKEFSKVWDFQKEFYPEYLTEDFKRKLIGKSNRSSAQLFNATYKLYTAENKGKDKKQQAIKWRVDALSKRLSIEEVAFVLCELNGAINNSSGYLGAISDRSKELYFNRQTIGQYIVANKEIDPHFSVKNKVFYRQDYLDEFETIWRCQKQFHPELTDELKHIIRDIIIFYQRPLKSQKGLISYCEFESQIVEKEVDGKTKKITIGSKVAPKSSPLFQDFKIWQGINNLLIINDGTKIELKEQEKEKLHQELSYVSKLSDKEILKLLGYNPKTHSLNFKEVEGNRTQYVLFEAYEKIIIASGHNSNLQSLSYNEAVNKVSEIFNILGIQTDILYFNPYLQGKEIENQPMYQLWHLLYSYEGDNSTTGNELLIEQLQKKFSFPKEYGKLLANISFEDDYASLSSKAIKKILPYLREGHKYNKACELAGYRHSKSSLTKKELDNKVLLDRLENLPKNSLRNPVVEKILNQMINVVNAIIAEYGKPDEIRIELARELKNNAKKRAQLTNEINQATRNNERIKERLAQDFGLTHISSNDILRLKLYDELAVNGYKTLYSNKKIDYNQLLSEEYQIEHIIPRQRKYDDSFSNKTIELSDVNLKKSNRTAYEFVLEEYGPERLNEYVGKISNLLEDNKISATKCKNLLAHGDELKNGFIHRDINDTQYIARKAKEILEQIVRRVISTSGSITDVLRNDWQIVDVMKELNWDKYEKLGEIEYLRNSKGNFVGHIKDWSKRNDHRHHAMDALTIAFTKEEIIQHINTSHARDIENEENNDTTALKFNNKYRMPMPNFRAEAKKHLEDILVSIKAKNKVVTQNINKSKGANGISKKVQLTPRGQLHLETVYGKCNRYVTAEVKVGKDFTAEYINEKVADKAIARLLLNRLSEYNGNPQKAFTGQNSLDKNPIVLKNGKNIPSKVKVVTIEEIFTIRKEINKDIKLDKVIDVGVRKILEERLKLYNGDADKAFSNLDENPIYLNKEKGITIKKVTIDAGLSKPQALHDKKDNKGSLVLDINGDPMGSDYVAVGNNHHVAVYRDSNGDLQEVLVPFIEATTRAILGNQIVDKNYRADEGWEFLFTMKQNELFVFPNKEKGFNPMDIDLLDPANYSVISPNLYRVQKLSSKDYTFRHHLETTVETRKSLQEYTWKRITSFKHLEGIVKVRINHIGQIVTIGEY